jgi:Tfp pilus assembly protein PilV
LYQKHKERKKERRKERKKKLQKLYTQNTRKGSATRKQWQLNLDLQKNNRHVVKETLRAWSEEKRRNTQQQQQHRKECELSETTDSTTTKLVKEKSSCTKQSCKGPF